MLLPWNRWPRSLYFLGALAAAGLMAYAFYSEHYLYLEPCPLCMWQRLFVILIGATYLLAAITNPARCAGVAYAWVIGLWGVLGAAVSVRHVWIQHLPPDQVPMCQQISFGNMPFADFLAASLRGTGECADSSWHFLGLTMPAWLLICFACYVIGAWLLALRTR